MIQPGPSAGGRPYSDRPDALQGQDLLRCVLEALPVGIGLFEIRGDEFTLRAGNRELARVLRLERLPSDGTALADVFNRGQSVAVRKLFQEVQASHDPQSYFAAEDREGAEVRGGARGAPPTGDRSAAGEERLLLREPGLPQVASAPRRVDHVSLHAESG